MTQTDPPVAAEKSVAEKMQLATHLSEVWDADLAAECAVELGLTDWQLNELRFKLIYVWDAERERWVKREWFRHAGTGKTVYFPEPIVSKHRWKPIFTALCEKHRVELVGNGSVAQRSFSDGLALLLTRTDSLLPAPDSSGRTRVMASVGWDAIKHAGRHLVHGGVKLASFKEAVSTQSELNFVTTNIWRDNDDHAGLVRGLGGGGPTGSTRSSATASSRRAPPRTCRRPARCRSVGGVTASATSLPPPTRKPRCRATRTTLTSRPPSTSPRCAPSAAA